MRRHTGALHVNGISHFDVLWDDSRMAWLYTRLVLGICPRARRLLACRVEQAR
jgi:hypothetical protein